MCGRYTVSKAEAVLGEFFVAEFSETHIPIFNASPGQHLPVILDAAPRIIRPAFWGFMEESGRPGRMRINARSETAHRRPMFRESLGERRCLVIADGFYEWQARRGGKQPHRIVLKSDAPFAFAGIWRETAGAPAFVILTTVANAVTRPIHDRMPVILERDEMASWLDRQRRLGDVLRLLDPYPEDEMRAYPVSSAVNSSKNGGDELIAPAVDGPQRQASLF